MYPENKNKKTRFVCIFHWKPVFGQFFLDPALYYATPRHNPLSDFFKNGLKLSARLEEKKSWSFNAKKITTGWDITKNVEGADSSPGSFRVKNLQLEQKTSQIKQKLYTLSCNIFREINSTDSLDRRDFIDLIEKDGESEGWCHNKNI